MRVANENGASDWSPFTAAIRVPTPPSAPQLVKTVPRDSCVWLTVARPSSDGGMAVESLEVETTRRRPAGHHNTPPTTVARAAASSAPAAPAPPKQCVGRPKVSRHTPFSDRVAVAGLVNGDEYTFRVRCRNACGASEWSASKVGTESASNAAMMRTQTHAGANEPVAGADGAGVVPCVPAPIPRGACRRNALANLFEPQQTAAATAHGEHAQQEEDEEGAMSAGDARAGKGWGKLKTRIAAGRAASFIGEAHLGNIADDAASSDGEGGRPRSARTYHGRA